MEKHIETLEKMLRIFSKITSDHENVDDSEEIFDDLGCMADEAHAALTWTIAELRTK